MKKALLILSILLYPTLTFAQNINIDADDKVEWYRDEQKMIAYGNAIATKEANSLKGDTITAFYEKIQLEDGTQKNQIQKIISENNVKLQTADAQGFGEYFDYYLPLKTAILKGKPARIVNNQGELTATESITYYDAENKSIALGDVIAKNQDYTIHANKMISFFDTDKQGKKSLNRVEIYANAKPIKIINKQATVTGERGIYFPIENKLKVFDNVVINQNNDILKGDYAETDLTTGISRLLATNKSGRRVSGIFRNKNKKK